MTITIDHYTATWDKACRPRIKLRVGMHVRVSYGCDDREYNAFRRRLADDGLILREFIRWMPRLRVNVYRIERITP